jgi:hypothetical protein
MLASMQTQTRSSWLEENVASGEHLWIAAMLIVRNL